MTDLQPEHSTGQYVEYMRIDELLSLQRRPDEVVHRDEVLFQIVHQVTELLLKLACHEIDTATESIESGDLDRAARLVGRAALGVHQATGVLELLSQISPADFQKFRVVLGNGSGAESPGWSEVRAVSRRLGSAFARIRGSQAALVEVYQGSQDVPIYRLAEAMVEWDQRVGLWRARHYETAARTLGEGADVVGTAGTPLEAIRKRIRFRLFPQLWQARAGLRESAEPGPPAGG